jgi:MSHA biogenesis protein MshJ
VNATLKRYVERIDNASVRERALLFGAAALVLVFIVNSALIEPLRAKQRRLVAETAQRERELRTVQAEVQRQALSRAADPDAQNRRRATELRAELASLEARIVAEQRRFTSPQRMREVLEEMLERDKRLRLVDLKTLPITDLAGTQGQAGRRIFRHGVELTLSGSYLDLHAYLAALERMPTQLYWGKVEMSVSAYPVTTLKLTVYTLSFDKAWLVV